MGLIAPGSNDQTMNRPLRPPSGATGGGSLNSAGGFPITQVDRSFNPANYQSIIQVPKTLLIGTGEVILFEPPDVRVYFYIRNAASSLGLLAYSFVSDPQDETLAFDLLAPGEKKEFPSGGFVPQQRVYVRAFNGDCFAVAAYANYGSS